MPKSTKSKRVTSKASPSALGNLFDSLTEVNDDEWQSAPRGRTAAIPSDEDRDFAIRLYESKSVMSSPTFPTEKDANDFASSLKNTLDRTLRYLSNVGVFTKPVSGRYQIRQNGAGWVVRVKVGDKAIYGPRKSKES